MTTSTHPAPAHKGRMINRVVGAVLWTLVAVALLIMYRSNSDGDPRSKPSAAGTAAINTQTPDDAAQRQPDTPAPLVQPPMNLPEFQLTDVQGNTVTRADLIGHPCVFSFVFSRCVTTCRPITAAMKQLHDRLADTDTQFVTITVDPDFDTVEQFGKFAEIYEPDPDRWHFLTGSKEAIYKLITGGFNLYVEEVFGEARRPGYEVAHTNRVVLVNPTGHPVATFLAVNAGDMARLRQILEGKQPFPDPPPPPADEDAESAEKNKDDDRVAPAWVLRLPAVNAGLNGVATILLITGLLCIRRNQRVWHKRAMLTAFLTSVAFLGTYLIYHFALHHYTGRSSRPFEGSGLIRGFYFAILISHVVLATTIPVLAPLTIVRGLQERWDRHRRLARITFPIWVYVSVTGVMIYLMLYHWPVNGQNA